MHKGLVYVVENLESYPVSVVENLQCTIILKARPRQRSVGYTFSRAPRFAVQQTFHIEWLFTAMLAGKKNINSAGQTKYLGMCDS